MVGILIGVGSTLFIIGAVVYWGEKQFVKDVEDVEDLYYLSINSRFRLLERRLEDRISMLEEKLTIHEIVLKKIATEVDSLADNLGYKFEGPKTTESGWVKKGKK